MLATDYDHQRRTEASENGFPTRRLAGPGYPVTPDRRPTYFFRRSGRLMCFDTDPEDTHEAVKGDVSWIGSIHLGDRMIVAADIETVTAMRKLIDKHTGTGESGRQFRSAKGALVMASTLGTSSRLVVATRALTNAWWLPVGMNPKSAADWRTAFDVRSGPSALVSLHRFASETTEHGDNPASADLLKKIVKQESVAISNASKRSFASQVDAFGAAVRVAEMWNAYLACDAIYIERAVVTGQASACSTVDESDEPEQVTAAVTSPFRLRSGASLLFVDKTGVVGGGSLAAIEWDTEDGLVAVIKQGKRNDEGTLSRFKAAIKNGRFMAVTTKPFTLVVHREHRHLKWASLKSQRSSKGAPPTCPNRLPVPTDVLFAAMPTDGSVG